MVDCAQEQAHGVVRVEDGQVVERPERLQPHEVALLVRGAERQDRVKSLEQRSIADQILCLFLGKRLCGSQFSDSGNKG